MTRRLSGSVRYSLLANTTARALIQYRPFLNSDIPALIQIWRRQPPQRALVQPVTSTLLERYVFAKPYFDRFGLLLAWEDGQAIGFVHAGFESTDDFSSVDYRRGVISALMVLPREDRSQLAQQLIQMAEEYLRQKGAQRVTAIGVSPRTPFYLGMYGGSQLSGVLSSDQHLLSSFQEAGYEKVSERRVLQRELIGFHPLVDRHQIKIRRSYQLKAIPDPRAESWWQACTLGLHDRLLFNLVPRRGGPLVAQIEFWNIEPLADTWAVQTMGVLNVKIPADRRQQGFGTFLLGESLRQLETRGIRLVEAHVPQSDEGANRLFEKLGFRYVDRGLELVCPLSQTATAEFNGDGR